jgi:hypothetical protein
MGLSWRDAIGRTSRIGVYPLAAVVAFAIFSRIVIGRWFVAGGFFVPENTALGRPLEAFAQIGWGVRELSGLVLLVAASLGLATLIARALSDATQSWLVVPLSLTATAALPWFAFLQGHPYRIRYMVPLIAAQALGIGALGGSTRRFRPAIAAGLIVLTAFELRPLDARAPMVVEAQWDRPNITVRQHVTDCLRAGYDGDAVMASMGSLGHYMQELAAAGFRLRDFLHEGNGDVWLAALEHPYPYAGWLLIEEKAEGGDMLAAIARENPGFLEGFSRVCEGAGVALYRRALPARPPAGGALSFRTSP